MAAHNRQGLIFAANHDAIVGMHEAQHISRNLFDEIAIGHFGCEESNVALELGTHGLEATNFELQEAFALDESVPCQETVAAIQSVIGEVETESETRKQHKCLPDCLPPILMRLTQHVFLFWLYAG